MEWPCKPAIRDRGRPGQCGGHDGLRLGWQRLPDGQVRRDGWPVLPVPQRSGDEQRPLRLYYAGMAAEPIPTIRITQNGSAPGNYSYTVTGSDSQGVNCPAFDISWGDAARFCNWLQNGQPNSGTEGNGTTETGAYTLSGEHQAHLMTETR